MYLNPLGFLAGNPVTLVTGGSGKDYGYSGEEKETR